MQNLIVKVNLQSVDCLKAIFISITMFILISFCKKKDYLAEALPDAFAFDRISAALRCRNQVAWLFTAVV
jgi:hypothetical protein